MEEPTQEEVDSGVNELIDKVDYVQRWLDCAPDFPVLAESLLLKIAMDRGGELIAPEEVHRVHAWIENFYKYISAIMGTLESHIVLQFADDGQGPNVALTEKGEAWVKHHQQNGPGEQ